MQTHAPNLHCGTAFKFGASLVIASTAIQI
jgi:hypothetical protein